MESKDQHSKTDFEPRRGSLVSSFLFPIGTFTKPEVNNQPRRFQADNGNVERYPSDQQQPFEELHVPVFQRRGSMLVPGGVHGAEYKPRPAMEERGAQPNQGRRLSDYFSALVPSNWFGPKQN